MAATAYATADAITDALLYVSAKRMVLEKISSHPRFREQIGGAEDPCIIAGPWFNASVSVSSGGMLAAVTLPVTGSQRSSDVIVRVRTCC